MFPDVSKLESFKEFAKEVESIVGENGLNVLINNAGVAVVGKSSDLRTASYEEYLHVFNTNYFGSVFLSQVSFIFLINIFELIVLKNFFYFTEFATVF